MTTRNSSHFIHSKINFQRSLEVIDDVNKVTMIEMALFLIITCPFELAKLEKEIEVGNKR